MNISAVHSLISKLRTHPTLILMDTEQTCWEGTWERHLEGKRLPHEMREVIQIGAVKVDTQTFQVQQEFDKIVTPVFNPVLSAFCEELTGVTNARVAKEGVPFIEALNAFEAFCDGAPVMVYNADADVFRENLEFHAVEHSIPEYMRIREELVACGVNMDGINSGAIARHLGSEKTYREHDALADVTSMADGLAILARSCDNV